MKKLTMGVGVLALSLGISATAGAATAYYIEYMDGMKESTQKQVTDHFQEVFKDADSRLYHNTIAYAYGKMDDIEKQADRYAEDKVAEYYNEKYSKNTTEINQHAQEILNELKSQIDQKIAEHKKNWDGE